MGPQQLPRYYRKKNPPTDSIFWGNPLPLPRMQNSASGIHESVFFAWGFSRRKNTPKSRDPLEWCQWLASRGPGVSTLEGNICVLVSNELSKGKHLFESNPGISKNKTYLIKINTVTPLHPCFFYVFDLKHKSGQSFFLPWAFPKKNQSYKLTLHSCNFPPFSSAQSHPHMSHEKKNVLLSIYTLVG